MLLWVFLIGGLMNKIIVSLMFLSLDVFAGPQAMIIRRNRETNRMNTLYSRELPSRSTYDTLRNHENNSGGASYRRYKEADMKNRCFNLNDRDACDYVRNYL